MANVVVSYMKAQHGTRSMYQRHQCRCNFCSNAEKAYQREYQKKNRKKRNAYVRKYNQARRDTLSAIKLAAGCTDCGYSEHASALHFDHLPQFDKVDNVSAMVVQNASWVRILEEVGKCEVVCANCHAVRTSTRLMGANV